VSGISTKIASALRALHKRIFGPQSPLERQQMIMASVRAYRSLLTDDEAKFVRTVEARLRADEELTPEHEEKLVRINKRCQEEAAW
jgi:predicted thioredoxin/glutaredoxin